MTKFTKTQHALCLVFSIEKFMWSSSLLAFTMLHTVTCSIGTNTVEESKLVVDTALYYGDADLRIFQNI
jgi:hypothetical protein